MLIYIFIIIIIIIIIGHLNIYPLRAHLPHALVCDPLRSIFPSSRKI
jgi:hypothetical protein